VTIGDVGRRSGLRPSAIRWYESIGLLPAPKRRIYDEGVIERLGIIRLAQEAGFSVAEIWTLLSGFARATAPPARWRALAERKLDDVRTAATRLREMERVLEAVLRCRCPTLEDCGRAMTRRPEWKRARPASLTTSAAQQGRPSPPLGRKASR